MVQVLNNQFMASLCYKSFCDLRTSRIPISPALSEGLNATWVVCNKPPGIQKKNKFASCQRSLHSKLAKSDPVKCIQHGGDDAKWKPPMLISTSSSHGWPSVETSTYTFQTEECKHVSYTGCAKRNSYVSYFYTANYSGHQWI